MQDLLSPSLANFHFIRPMLLLALLVIPFAWLLLTHQFKNKNNWSQLIDTVLLNFLQNQEQDQRRVKRRAALPCLILALLIVAASGPTWVQKPSEVHQSPDSLVLILDLSISMLAQDTAPSRLVRAKQKLQDLLAYREQGFTALIAFSGDSHIVTPLTDDVRTISSNLSALEPLMMPVIGSRPDLAIDQAVELINSSGAAKGRIIMLTDGVAEHQMKRIAESLNGQDIALNILAAGTSEGGPIDIPGRGYLKEKGSVVIPKTNFSELATLAETNAGKMYAIALDDRDLLALKVDGSFSSSMSQDNSENQEGTEAKETVREYDQWEDMAYILALIALPLCLLAYRQGAFLVLCFLILTPEESQAFEWSELWQTRDQRAQELLQQERFSEAASTFKSKEHAAQSFYRGGEYDQAAASYAEKYQEEKDPKLLYNQANSLARAGKLEEALAAYDQVLEQDENDEDAAFNRNLVEQLLKQAQKQNGDSSGDQSQEQKGDQSDQNSEQQSGEQSEQQSGDQSEAQQNEGQQQESQQSDSSDQQDPSNSDSGSENKSQSSKNQSGEQNQDEQTPSSSSNDIEELKKEREQAQQSENDSESNADETNESELTAQQQQQLSELNEQSENLNDGSMAVQESLSSEDQQSYEQWMRRVPDNPSGLLQRKFEQQARERNRERTISGEPLW
jgi:Ca-activated chloride channel homolog